MCCNNFNIATDIGEIGTGTYLLGAMLNHSLLLSLNNLYFRCDPNCVATFEGRIVRIRYIDECCLFCRNIEPISAGTEV